MHLGSADPCVLQVEAWLVPAYLQCEAYCEARLQAVAILLHCAAWSLAAHLLQVWHSRLT